MSKTMTSKKTAPKNRIKGLLTREVKDEAIYQQVWAARQEGMSFNALEGAFGLKPANGMTAYRVFHKACAMLADSKKAPRTSKEAADEFVAGVKAKKAMAVKAPEGVDGDSSPAKIEAFIKKAKKAEKAAK